MATKRTKMGSRMDEGSRGGFTIIEVVLVLAIAGLIFLMVFIALPALQRSQRDTQRRNDLGRLETAITQFQTNNNGRIPGGTAAGSTFPADFITQYLVGKGGDPEEEFADPSLGAYKIVLKPNSEASNTLEYGDATIYYYVQAKCEEDGKAVPSTGNRDYAIRYKLEGSGTYCQDNGGAAKSK